MITWLADADTFCGAKAHHLGRLLHAGFHVPDGFVVRDLRDGWQDDLARALARLGDIPVAVRSSARGEDGGAASFAGQLRTTLGARGPTEVLTAIQHTTASAASRRATAYAARTGRAVDQQVPVLVQALVRADAAGVAFTRHPVTGEDQVVIEAVQGLGNALVDGNRTPASWVVDGDTVAARSVDPVLTEPQARALAGLARRVEAVLGDPQDVEWAIAGDTAWVLQARPITTHPGDTAWAPPESGDLLVAGTAASPGTATGPARVVHGFDDFGTFRPGEVLVCRTTSPAWTPLLARAAAVVTEVGGALAHAAIVAREFGIPAVVAAPRATSMLTDGRTVSVDGSRGTVHEDLTAVLP
ncbi:PEP/pyruvate-binding domain-containing protein [Isoptericola croceus]|uniref:PEP/pyruvate-binding domain-containing protein n=1 Tax=Isoptericola croceus TaxID=3031406 RepID=UPI0023F83D00|nr:PEP/pyruvate-binding domain-containing protein [Isoptericola croceus]